LHFFIHARENSREEVCICILLKEAYLVAVLFGRSSSIVYRSFYRAKRRLARKVPDIISEELFASPASEGTDGGSEEVVCQGMSAYASAASSATGVSKK
jgi:hypothetical protein